MKFVILSIIILSASILSSQEYTYEVNLEAIEIESLGGLQSYATAQIDGEWLIVGGRLDGLHQRQPFASFNVSGNNNMLIVVNPLTKDVWKAPLSDLSENLQNQLSSTNMQFHQVRNYLILTGGYGYNSSSNSHITFPFITVININNLIHGIKNGNINPLDIHQKEDEKFAVTGGYLEKIGDTFYLVAGQRFDGSYNPMGPNHGPGFSQEYTNEIRPFNITIEENDFIITHKEAIKDELHLHRRDYNLLPQIRAGAEELMVFSGVFQTTANIPWLYPVSISSEGHEPLENFTQHYNHYHCASIPIYNEEEDEMHNLFFGGIAQFYDDNGTMVQDNDVPFVNSIADVSRMSNGSLIERLLVNKMPSLLGAGSEFIPMANTTIYENGVLNGDEIGDSFQEIGYIYGGIRSSRPNIFFINTGNQSEASSTIYKVMLRKHQITSAVKTSIQESSLQIYPNPAQNFVRLEVELNEIENIEVKVYDLSGVLVGSEVIIKGSLEIGKNYIVLDKLNVKFGAYNYNIKIGDQMISRKVIWSR